MRWIKYLRKFLIKSKGDATPLFKVIFLHFFLSGGKSTHLATLLEEKKVSSLKFIISSKNMHSITIYIKKTLNMLLNTL